MAATLARQGICCRPCIGVLQGIQRGGSWPTARRRADEQHDGTHDAQDPDYANLVPDLVPQGNALIRGPYSPLEYPMYSTKEYCINGVRALPEGPGMLLCVCLWAGIQDGCWTARQGICCRPCRRCSWGLSRRASSWPAGLRRPRDQQMSS